MNTDKKQEEAELEMNRETVPIEGDRKLYNYTFTLKKEEEEPKRNEEQ